MTDTMYLAGDLSGIQRFVLRVKSAGKAQAKRLRAPRLRDRAEVPEARRAGRKGARRYVADERLGPGSPGGALSPAWRSVYGWELAHADAVSIPRPGEPDSLSYPSARP